MIFFTYKNNEIEIYKILRIIEEQTWGYGWDFENNTILCVENS